MICRPGTYRTRRRRSSSTRASGRDSGRNSPRVEQAQRDKSNADDLTFDRERRNSNTSPFGTDSFTRRKMVDDNFDAVPTPSRKSAGAKVACVIA